MFIYKITNIENNKFYIGQTTKAVDKRFREHLGSNNKSLISRAIKKYSRQSFFVDTICECLSLDELNERELYYIGVYGSKVPNGYNLTDGGRTNYTLTPESIKKISDSKIGDLNSSKRPEVREKIRQSLLGRPGTKHTEEMKQFLSDINKGNKHCLGLKHSEDTKKKISESLKGPNHPMYGKHHTEEHKKKVSESLRGEKNHNYGKHMSDETKKKISESVKKTIRGKKC
jgi:group I intron endonuclease